ncbi:helix-turn-helix domain-containing protein [Spirillospora sp. CA-253888]
MPQPPKKLTPGRSPQDLFGSEVRRYRELAGLSLTALADRIPYAASTIGTVERGECGCDRVFAEVCDQVLDTRDALVHLWDGLLRGRSAFPTYFAEWPEHESRAVTLRTYQPIIIDGLLQTEDYASALLYGSENDVRARMERQTVLTGEAPPRLVYLLPEIVLWHRVGTAQTMYEQLHRLADSISPTLAVQVLPDGSPHPGNLGAFVIARLPGGEHLAYCDGEPHGRIVEGRTDLDRLQERFTDLATYALPADMSGALIRQTAEERWKT